MINKYLGTYRIFMPTMENGKPTTNENDTYLKCKYGIEIYRFDKKTLAIYFLSNSTVNNILPKFQEAKVELKPFVRGDGESIWLFEEKKLSIVAEIVKPQIKGKNIQAKSVRTARKVNKQIKQFN